MISEIKDRIEQLNTRAARLRTSTAKGRQKRRNMGPVKIPDATHAVATMLDEEVTYRILSAVAHGHSWAIQQLGFEIADMPAGDLAGNRICAARIRKALTPIVVAWLCSTAALAFCRPVWYVFNYEGWDTGALQKIFEESFDRLGAVESIRFWR